MDVTWQQLSHRISMAFCYSLVNEKKGKDREELKHGILKTYTLTRSVL